MMAGFRKTVLFLTVIIVTGRAGEIIATQIPALELQHQWPVHLYLPDNYSATQDKVYPVLFLLHGSGGDETDWDRIFPLLDSLISNRIIAPLLAVAPATGTSWWVDSKENFEAAFFNDLLPWLSSHYSITNDRTGRVVVGFSMGGYGALRYSLDHPDIFSGAILLSAAIYDELPPDGSSARESGSFGQPFNEHAWITKNFTTLLINYWEQPNRVWFFIACGDDDWSHAESIDYNVEQQAVRLFGVLNKQHGNPAELRIVNGGHNWDIWQPLLLEALELLPTRLAPFAADKSMK